MRILGIKRYQIDKNHMKTTMNKSKIWAMATTITILVSCQTDAEKADKLRMENKFEDAAELYQKGADSGDPYAKWHLAYAYELGEGVNFDKNKAIMLFKEAAEAGSDEAKWDYAVRLYSGEGNLKTDTVFAKKIIDKLIKSTDNSYALSRCAGLLLKGFVLEKDEEKAVELLNKVKDKNEPIYLVTMADLYRTGTDKIDIDYAKSLEYYNKAFENGNRYSAYIIGRAYLDGDEPLEKDTDKAIEWYKKGITRNSVDCMYALASIYLSEDTAYVKYVDPNKGFSLLKKTMLHGKAEAYLMMGYYYRSGKYIEKDDKKANECYEKATELGSSEGAYSLGFSYINGLGYEKDVKKGIQIWEKAAELGSGSAANNLYCYYYGDAYGNKHKDRVKAKKYLELAAKLKDSYGCRNLAYEYYYGNGLYSKNYNQAYIYMRIAADQGDYDACQALAYFLKNGIGCNKDPKEAEKYENKKKNGE